MNTPAVCVCVFTYLTVCVRGVLKVVHEGNEEAGDEAGQREQNGPHSEAGEGQPDEGPVPVQAAVRPLEHPGPRDRRTTTRSHVGSVQHVEYCEQVCQEHSGSRCETCRIQFSRLKTNN